MLKDMHNRIDLPWDENAEREMLDTEKLYDALDTNNDGFLSYDELNKAMALKENQLKEFVYRMNHDGALEIANDSVSKEVFVDHFFETIEHAARFDPSVEDTTEIFEDVAGAQGNSLATKINLYGLTNSDLGLYLTFAQIDQIIKGLLKIIPAKDNLISKALFIENFPKVFFNATQGEFEKMSEGVDIAFENLSLHVSVGKKEIPIVQNVTGRLQQGTMTALMGGSGAGKTSLLNALCGRAFYGNVSGKIVINGNDTSINGIMDNVGFVPQDDIVYAELTVRENFLFAGKFRLPAGTSETDIRDLADETIANLALTRVASSIVGDVTRRGVSGGEKKRVNIGLELMANPSILFLDEPTSGLDSSSAMVVMHGLKTLVERKGVTICSVIHQPRKSIFALFDSLVLLSAGGNLVYHGPTLEARLYFQGLGYFMPEGESVADWLIDISSGRLQPINKNKRTVKNHSLKKSTCYANDEENQDNMAKFNRARLSRAWDTHMEGLDVAERQRYSPPSKSRLPRSRVKQSFFSQLFTHVRRNFLVSKRNASSRAFDTIILAVAVLLICAIDGVLVLTSDAEPKLNNEYEILTTEDPEILQANSNEIARGLFRLTISNGTLADYANKASIIVCVLLGISTAKVLTEKRLEMFREAGSGYDLNAYYLSVQITSTIEHLTEILFIGAIASWMRYTAGSPWCSLLNYVMLGWVVTSWSLLFPLFVPPKSVVLVISFFNLFFGILFSGTTSPGSFRDIYSDKFIEFIASFFSPPRYFIETMMVSEFRVLPSQTGMTLQADMAPGLPFNVMDDVFKIGQKDMPNASTQSYNGWYQLFLAPFLVGLTVRFLGAVLINSCNRSQQAKSSFLTELKSSTFYRINIFILVALFLICFLLSLYVILLKDEA